MKTQTTSELIGSQGEEARVCFGHETMRRSAKWRAGVAVSREPNRSADTALEAWSIHHG